MCSEDVDQLRTEIENLRSDVTGLQNDIADLERDLSDLGQQVRDLKRHDHPQVYDLQTEIRSHVSSMTPHRFGQ